MKVGGEDLRKALIALSFGLEPIIFAIVGWYAGPYLNLTNATGALLGVIVGFGIMFWRIWKFSSALGFKARYDPEREDLRALVSLVEKERYKVTTRHDIMKIMGSRDPIQLLNVLKSISVVKLDFYDLKRLNDVLDEMMDFSNTLIEFRMRAPMEFLKVLDDFNDFLTVLCVNFAFRSEAYGDEVARGYVVTPFKLRGEVRSLLHEDLKDYLANDDVRELYAKALSEAIAINSRGPLLALVAYSLLKVVRDLETTKYAYAYSNELRKLACMLFSIATEDLRKEGKESTVVKKIEQEFKGIRGPLKSDRKDGEREEDVLRSFINDSFIVLKASSRIPLTAKAVLSYLFVKWSEKVSLKLALMAVRNEISPQDAYRSLLIPY